MSDFWARMPPFRDSNSSRRSDCSVASARNACSWVMFVFHSSRCWSSVRSSVVLSSVVDSVLPSVVGRLVVRRPVGRCRWSSCRWSSGRLSVVGRRSLSSSVSRWSSVVLSVVRRPSSVSLPGPSASELSRDSLPNSLPPRSSRLSSSASRATHCQPAFLLSASVDSSDNRLGCLARASLRFPPPGFRSSASASGSASLVHFPSSSSRLPSPPWPSPGFSRSPGSVLSSSPRRSRQTSLGPVPRHSLRSLGLPRGFPSLRVPLLGFVSALPSGSLLGPFWVPSGSLLGPFWGRLSWPPSHTSPVGQFTLAVSRLFMTCRGSGPIHTSRDRAPPSLPRLRGFSPHFVRAPPSLLFTSCTSFLSPILSLP